MMQIKKFNMTIIDLKYFNWENSKRPTNIAHAD